jgi:hypothetical protein
MDISLNGTSSETDRSESSACTASASFEELQVEDAPIAHNIDSDSESEHSTNACCSPVCCSDSNHYGKPLSAVCMIVVMHSE